MPRWCMSVRASLIPVSGVTVTSDDVIQSLTFATTVSFLPRATSAAPPSPRSRH
jgi:hypothetical protein